MAKTKAVRNPRRCASLRQCTVYLDYTAFCKSNGIRGMPYLGLSSQPSIGLSRRRLSWCLTVPSVKSPFAVSTPVAACVKACGPLMPARTGLAGAAPSGTVVLLDANNDIYASTGSFTLHGRAAAQIGALNMPKAAPLCAA
jgi:hypothetical protein